MLLTALVVVMVLAAGLGVFTTVMLKTQAERDREQRKAVLKVIDGIGRGGLYAIESAIFRIGAANASRAEEKNDLVISDADANVSRHHCSIVRKDGDYYLMDSSMNGTYLNNVLLKRGEPHRLEDGDEVRIANVSKMKFLYT